jgi:hypothetical protein
MGKMDEQGDWINKAALAAYRTVNPGGPAFSTLSVDYQDKWRVAYGEARSISPTVIMTKVPMELNRTTLEYAIGLLGNPPYDRITLHSCSYYRLVSHELSVTTGCCFVELPSEALKTVCTWIIRSPDGIVYSCPSF